RRTATCRRRPWSEPCPARCSRSGPPARLLPAWRSQRASGPRIGVAPGPAGTAAAVLAVAAALGAADAAALGAAALGAAALGAAALAAALGEELLLPHALTRIRTAASADVACSRLAIDSSSSGTLRDEHLPGSNHHYPNLGKPPWTFIARPPPLARRCGVERSPPPRGRQAPRSVTGARLAHRQARPRPVARPRVRERCALGWVQGERVRRL